MRERDKLLHNEAGDDAVGKGQDVGRGGGGTASFSIMKIRGNVIFI